jgi:hypothetical protein
MPVEFRVPIIRRRVFQRWLLEIELSIEVKTDNGWKSLPFLFDPGSQFTSIPIPLAEENGIPYDVSHPVTTHGTTGSGVGFLSPITFSFPALPMFEFQALCNFGPVLKRPLFSLTDTLDHFAFRTLRPTDKHPLGSFVLRLHKSHKGRPRT